MKRSDLFFYTVVAFLALVYFIGAATGYLLFAMLIILPAWASLLNGIGVTK